MQNKQWLSINDMMGQSNGDLDNGKMSVVEVNIAQLHMFEGHPFKLYEGERLEQMIQSIKDFGVLTPILVRSIKRGKFEILAGHNRMNAAKLAGLETVPAIVKDNVDDEDAMFIVTETNLMQRSFSDMSYSERAFALQKHHVVSTNQGKRTDLWSQVEVIETNGNQLTSCQVGEKLGEINKVGEAFELSSRTVSRYLRICELIKPLQQRLDSGEIAFTVAETLSYLSKVTQESLELFLIQYPRNISYKQAHILKTYGSDDNLGVSDIEELLLREDRSDKELGSVKIGAKVISRFFKSTMSKKEVERIVEEALEQYFKVD